MMEWPIAVIQDKVAMDIKNTYQWSSSTAAYQEILDRGFRKPASGPWASWGYWWRWGRCPPGEEIPPAPDDNFRQQVSQL